MNIFLFGNTSPTLVPTIIKKKYIRGQKVLKAPPPLWSVWKNKLIKSTIKYLEVP